MSDTGAGVAETLVQIRIEMAKLGEKMDQFKDMPDRLRSVEKTAELALQRGGVSENRLKNLEQGNTWLWRTVGASAIVTIAGLIVAFIKILGTQGG